MGYSMDRYNAALRRTTEDVALMCALTDTPRPPSESLLNAKTGSWKLDIEREKQLADDLAFLVYVRDDPNKVRAVCIEQDPNGSGITIRVAANTGDLSGTVQDLQRIADVMVQATRRDRSRSQTEQELQSQITRMCRRRILTRLRSKHAPAPGRKKKKPGLVPLLLSSLVQCRQLAKDEEAEEVISQIQSQAERLNRTFQNLESCQSSTETIHLIEALVSMAYDIDTDALATVFRQCPGLRPGLVAQLPTAIGKLARYARIGLDLAKLAYRKDNSLFQNIRVTTIPRRYSPTEMSDDAFGSFDQTWSRITDGFPNLHLTRSRSDLGQRYGDRLLESSRNGKVHAEIQLLFFYEHNSPEIPPRMVCANKSACYLCDLFVVTHGKLAVPRTHGRIYEKWCLPEWSSICDDPDGKVTRLVEQFNDVLEDDIRAVIRQNRISVAHPAESVLFPYRPWSSGSTILSALQTGSNVPYQQDRHAGSVSKYRSPRSRLSDEACRSSVEVVRSAVDSCLPSILAKPVEAAITDAGSSMIMQSGQKVDRALKNGDNFFVRAGSVAMDFSMSNTPGGFSSSIWHIAVEHIGRDSRTVGYNDGCQKIDLESLPPGQDTVVYAEGGSEPLKVLCCYKGQETLLTLSALISQRVDAVS